MRDNLYTSSSNSNREDARKVILKLLLFLPFLLVFVYTDYRVSLIPNSYSYKEKLLQNERNAIELLSFGSSHGYYDFNPDRIQCLKAFNLANTSQSLILDIKLLKKLQNKLPKLKIVMFFIDYFSFEYMLTDSPEFWRNMFYVRHYGVSENIKGWFDIKAYSSFARYGRDTTLDLLEKGPNISLNENISESGWFKTEDEGIISGNISFESGKSRVKFHDSIMKEKYRREILMEFEGALGELKPEVKVFLVVSPVLKTYTEYMNLAKWKGVLNTLHDISLKHRNIDIINIDQGHFSEADFVNNDHLNAKGANKLSDLINMRICHFWE